MSPLNQWSRDNEADRITKANGQARNYWKNEESRELYQVSRIEARSQVYLARGGTERKKLTV